MASSPKKMDTSIPTIPSDIIEEDIMNVNYTSKSVKDGKSRSNKSTERSKTNVQDVVFQMPKSVPIKKPKAKSTKTMRTAPVVGGDEVTDILVANRDGGKSRGQSGPTRKRKLPKQDGSFRRNHVLTVHSSILAMQQENGASLQRLKWHSKSVSIPSVEDIYEIRTDIFMNNINLECDLHMRPLKQNRFRGHLKGLSKSSMQVAQNIKDPISLKRAYFDQYRKWKQAKTLEVLSNGFYTRSPSQLRHMQYRNMSSRVHRIASNCAVRFGKSLSQVFPDREKDELDFELNEANTFAKLEETGQQIYRQMTQYMDFVAGSKEVTKSELSESTEKRNTSSLEKSSLVEKDTEKETKDDHGTKRKSLFPINISNGDGLELSTNGIEAVTAHSFSPTVKKNWADPAKSKETGSPEKTAGGKEDGELSDGADTTEDKSEHNDERGVDSDEAPLEIKPKAQSAEDEGAESSDRDSDTEKKKKKKRKKSKSSTTKKERKKKKKDKKSKEKSPDDLPKAYAMNRNEERSFPPMFRDQNRPYVRRGFQSYHQHRGGFRNFRYNNNFRMRGRGNWRGMNNPMHRNFNTRYQRPAGMFSHQRMLREKQFVSESESDDDKKLTRKRLKSSSPRKSISEAENPSEKRKRRSSESAAKKKKSEEIVIRDESDTEGSALNLLSEYV